MDILPQKRIGASMQSMSNSRNRRQNGQWCRLTVINWFHRVNRSLKVTRSSITMFVRRSSWKFVVGSSFGFARRAFVEFGSSWISGSGRQRSGDVIGAPLCVGRLRVRVNIGQGRRETRWAEWRRGETSARHGAAENGEWVLFALKNNVSIMRALHKTYSYLQIIKKKKLTK